ncbi:MAG: hypothetical protein NT047_00820 [Deltaproteobacteria bacterium]|nr:hypothetical protein [Deltaproteobacteria bacterium]
MVRSDVFIALPLFLAVDYDDALGIDMDQVAGDMGTFIVPFRCEVFLAGANVTEVCAGADTTPVVDFDLRPTAGSDASRGSADIAHLVLSTTARGKVMYDRGAKGTVLEPGQEVVVQLTTAATDAGGSAQTGHIKPFLLVKQVPETLGNLSGMTETT